MAGIGPPALAPAQLKAPCRAAAAASKFQHRYRDIELLPPGVVSGVQATPRGAVGVGISTIGARGEGAGEDERGARCCLYARERLHRSWEVNVTEGLVERAKTHCRNPMLIFMISSGHGFQKSNPELLQPQ